MVALAQSLLAGLKAKLAGWTSGGARRRQDMGLLREIDAGDQPVAEGVNGDDLELLAAGGADHQFVIDHGVADGDAVLKFCLILRKLRKGLGVTGPQRLATGFGRCAVQARDDAVFGVELHISVQVLGVIGIELLLGDVDSIHRSTSPNTISREPSTAETSASIWPLHM